MANEKPLVTLGVPVFNGARYLALALESLLKQSYEIFELIISDNASTDTTPEICIQYQRKDSRVHYVRNASNLGFAYNMNRLFQMAQGKYIMCTGANDLRDSNCLRSCLEVIETSESVVLCYPQTFIIDEDGGQYDVRKQGLDTRGLDQISRFRKVLWEMSWGDPLYGLIRVNALRRTRLLRSVWGHDHVLMAELSLLGEFAHISKPLFYRRERKGEQLTWGAQKHKIVMMIDPRLAQKQVYLPFWHMLLQHVLIIVHKSNLGPVQRFALLRELIRCFRARFWRRELRRDLVDLLSTRVSPKIAVRLLGG